MQWGCCFFITFVAYFKTISDMTKQLPTIKRLLALLSILVIGMGTIWASGTKDDYINSYLTLESLADNDTVILRIPAELTTEQMSWVAYSTDATNWTTMEVDGTLQKDTIILNQGEKVYFKGLGKQCDTVIDNYWYYVCIRGLADHMVYGNIMSLLYGDDFATQTAFPEGSTYAFGYLFNGDTHLVSVENLVLPATTLAFGCYYGLFIGCSSLSSSVPELPATEMKERCYMFMYYNCTALTEAPVLPALTLAPWCYYRMYNECTSLTSAPELPATTLADQCYALMFYKCSSLETIPELPATELAYRCYAYMFFGCTSLTTAHELPATTLAPNCYQSMFRGCTSLTTPPALPATTLADHCYEFMFYQCSSLATPPALPATTLAPDCYGWMFAFCTALQAACEMHVTTVDRYSCYCMYYNCNALATACELPATTMAPMCYGYMFADCTSLTEAPALPSTQLADSCYYTMFAGCVSLTAAPELPATTLTFNCYDNMFYYCPSLIEAPELPATTLADCCYRGMFGICTSLTKAPVLRAPVLTEECYAYMFEQCTELHELVCLATDISARDCTTGWFLDGSTSGTFYKAPGMEDWESGNNGIPESWTVKDYSHTMPLTLEAISDGDITFVYNLSYYHEHELTDIEYQINGGAWNTYTWNDAIAVVAGDKVAFRGNNASYLGNGTGYDSHITSTADVYVYGNIMSLINSTDYPTLTTLTGKDAFSHLFSVPGESPWDVVPNTTIKSHPTKDLVLPATTLSNMCYNSMFAGCQGLTRAPELPATEMPVACYASMFEGCTGLTAAPALPTTTFTAYGFDEVTFEEYGSIDCYMMMFKDCTSLTEAPALPALELVHGVYQNMFQGCTSLEKAPELPAPIVADYAYSYMFDGCTSLNYVKCLATEFEINPEFGNTAEDNVYNWLDSVAPTGTFIMAPGMTDWALNSPSGIPEGWTTYEHIFQTAGDWDVATNWNSGTVPTAGSNVVIAANVMVPSEYVADAGSVFIEEGNTLTIADGGQLKHSNEVQGTIQKFITGYGDVTNPGGYYLLGAPINMDSTVAVRSGMLDLVNGHVDFETHGIDLYEFSQGQIDGLEWLNMRFGNNFHTFGLLFNEACLYARADDAMLNISTTEDKKFVPTSVDNSIMVMRTISTPEPEFIGWNLIRNPYTCNAYLATGRDFYRMNAAGDAIVLATNENGGSAIKPCEGFFVVVGEHDPEQSIVHPVTGNTMTANIQMTTTEPQPNESKGILDITVKQEGQLADVARVRFDEGEHTGKLMLRNDATHLSITRDNKNYSVVHNEAQGELPLSFKAKKNGNYTLSVNPENVDVNYLHLIDNMTGTDVDLLALRQAQGPASYNFTAKTTDYESRFKLVFSANTEDGAADGSKTFAFYSNGNWIVNSNGESTLQVVDVTGRILSSHNINGSTEINLNQMPGVYMLRLINGTDVKVQKIVMQ